MLSKRKKKKPNLYGIAEWYGNLFPSLTPEKRKELAGLRTPKAMQCRFMQDCPDIAPKGETTCNKKGGVCSIRKFVPGESGQIDFGPITATCPSRFLEGRKIFKEIGKHLLGTEHPLIVKEIQFLQRIADNSSDEETSKEDVGRIDIVLIHPDTSRLEWCALEMQAVYFSGGSMSKDFEAIKNHEGLSLPLPAAYRRPDFRSSGPKRLMPQLQIKVPTLRRWGKKMAVVVDRPFIDSMGDMGKESDTSNCDIVWFVIRFDKSESGRHANLVVDDIRLTTLERSVEGLTAGVPVSLDNFEQKIRSKLPGK